VALALTLVALWNLGAPQRLLALVTAPGHRRAAAAIALGVAGWAGLILGGVRLALGIGREMTHEEIEEMARSAKFGPDIRSPLVQRRSKYRIYGPAKGLEGQVTVTFEQIRDAWQRGLWRRDPGWQTIFMMMISGIAMAIGGISAVFILGSRNTRIVFRRPAALRRRADRARHPRRTQEAARHERRGVTRLSAARYLRTRNHRVRR
jgi:hypothetical protein